MRSINPTFAVRAAQGALVVSFPTPARVLSWAVLNGGFCHADHVINHQVRGDDAFFCAQPARWLEQSALALGLRGKVVAMATAVEMRNLARVELSNADNEVTCIATVGCGNALSVGDPANVVTDETTPALLHTINMVLIVHPGLSDAAMVEAIQIATEGRVRALHEAGIRSSVSNLAATGTGTDCIAIVSLDNERENLPYCGKHTALGELIGLAAYTAITKGLAQSLTAGVSPEADCHEYTAPPQPGTRTSVNGTKSR